MALVNITSGEISGSGQADNVHEQPDPGFVVIPAHFGSPEEMAVWSRPAILFLLAVQLGRGGSIQCSCWQWPSAVRLGCLATLREDSLSSVTAPTQIIAGAGGGPQLPRRRPARRQRRTGIFTFVRTASVVRSEIIGDAGKLLPRVPSTFAN